MTKQQLNKLSKITSKYYCLLAEMDTNIIDEVDEICSFKQIPYYLGTNNLTESQLIQHLEILIECHKKLI